MPFARHFTTATALLTLLGATPALAVPQEEPLQAGIGNAGITIPYGFSGSLGASGLAIEALPTMLRVSGIAPGSAAALLDLPNPERYRVRLVAVNGTRVEDLTLRELQVLFNPERERVSLTLAKKGPQDPQESLVGPYDLPLSSQAVASLQARWLAAQRRFGEAHAFLADRQSDVATLDDTLLLAARDMAAAGDFGQALELVNRVGAKSPLHAEAQRLQARWRLAHLGAQLAQADALAAQGQFAAALALLGRSDGDDSWRKIKDARESQWKSALQQREAYKAAKKAMLVSKAHQAEATRRVREAERTAYQLEQRRHRERRAEQDVVASRDYDRKQPKR